MKSSRWRRRPDNTGYTNSNRISRPTAIAAPERIRELFDRVQHEFGALDIFVSNARPELAAFYQRPMELTVAH
jgi:NAD(P)-dependent dehydrogenase (short-subunit alcohol dehydrogenase family)